MNIFKGLFLFSLGIERKGLVITHPLMLISGLSRISLIVISPPMLWAYMNRGSSGFAWVKSDMTSFYSISIVAQPLGPPEYPKPVKSISSTSKELLAKK